jgi:hypothetical protein
MKHNANYEKTELEKCKEIKDDKLRLQCFNDLAKKSSENTRPKIPQFSNNLMIGMEDESTIKKEKYKPPKPLTFITNVVSINITDSFENIVFKEEDLNKELKEIYEKWKIEQMVVTEKIEASLTLLDDKTFKETFEEIWKEFYKDVYNYYIEDKKINVDVKIFHNNSKINIIIKKNMFDIDLYYKKNRQNFKTKKDMLENFKYYKTDTIKKQPNGKTNFENYREKKKEIVDQIYDIINPTQAPSLATPPPAPTKPTQSLSTTPTQSLLTTTPTQSLSTTPTQSVSTILVAHSVASTIPLVKLTTLKPQASITPSSKPIIPVTLLSTQPEAKCDKYIKTANIMDLLNKKKNKNEKYNNYILIDPAGSAFEENNQVGHIMKYSGSGLSEQIYRFIEKYYEPHSLGILNHTEAILNTTNYGFAGLIHARGPSINHLKKIDDKFYNSIEKTFDAIIQIINDLMKRLKIEGNDKDITILLPMISSSIYGAKLNKEETYLSSYLDKYLPFLTKLHNRTGLNIILHFFPNNTAEGITPNKVKQYLNNICPKTPVIKDESKLDMNIKQAKTLLIGTNFTKENNNKEFNYDNLADGTYDMVVGKLQKLRFFFLINDNKTLKDGISIDNGKVKTDFNINGKFPEYFNDKDDNPTKKFDYIINGEINLFEIGNTNNYTPENSMNVLLNFWSHLNNNGIIIFTNKIRDMVTRLNEINHADIHELFNKIVIKDDDKNTIAIILQKKHINDLHGSNINLDTSNIEYLHNVILKK